MFFLSDLRDPLNPPFSSETNFVYLQKHYLCQLFTMPYLTLNRASAGIYAHTVLYSTVLYCTVLFCTFIPQIPIPILTPNTKVQIPNTKVQNLKYARLVTNLP